MINSKGVLHKLKNGRYSLSFMQYEDRQYEVITTPWLVSFPDIEKVKSFISRKKIKLTGIESILSLL